MTIIRQFTVVLLLVLILALGTAVGLAQQVIDEEELDGPGSTIQSFVVICEDRVVVNFNGNMEPGFDIYFQAFTESQGGGTPLTTLRRASVNGEYSYGEAVPYAEGQVMPAGSVGSVYTAIARENDPDSVTFSEFIDDVQDGCSEPQETAGESVESGDGVSPTQQTTPASPILSPFGGFLNPGYVPPEKPLVQIGARPEFVPPRQETPGLIFAECNQYPVAEPGIIYDTDNVIVFWSWYASTAELVQEHIDTVDYSVTLYESDVTLPSVIRTEIEQRGSDYWVFYYSTLGNLRPGEYSISYEARWERAISDGYADFGPGTDNDILNGTCTFNVLPNLEGRDVIYTNWPVIGN
ncbi:MAG: hypothetical protein ACOCX3_04310 [Chloroflexota bacterium]